MSSTIRLTFLLLLCVFVAGILFAQDQPDPRRWSVDPRMTKLAATGEPAALPQANPGFVPPSQHRVVNTPIGTYTITPAIRVHPSTTVWQSEVPITRHPTNGNILYGSSNAVAFSPTRISEGMYLSTDGGVTWFGSDSTASAPITGHQGDPAPAIGPDGRLYQSYITTSGMGAAYSTNMGTTWANTITLVTGSQDKNHTFVDNAPGSPFLGRAYVTWSLFTAAAPPAVVSRTTDGGATWTPNQQVLPVVAGHYAQGVNGAVGPNGVAYIAWQSPVTASPFTGDFIGFGKSTDGGVTWTGNSNAYDCNGARNSSFAPWSIRINDFPSMAIDMTSGGRSGWIYIVTNEKSLAPAGTDEDIVMHRSTDGGTTWSAGVRVNQDVLNNGKKQFMPWMCVDEGGGLNVIYYDNRNSPAGDSVEVFVSRSLDGGTTWTDLVASDRKFRPAPIPGLAGGYQGDYIGITAANGKVYPYWADNTSGIYQAWVTSITTTEGFGWVKGTITSLGTATPVSGATVDFVDPIPQVSGNSNASGLYYAGARVDTPATTRSVVLRARKFGFIDTTFAITITRNDTLTRNFQMRPAPGGTLSVYSHTATGSLRSYVEVKFGAQVVVSDSTNATTGLLVVPLPVGTYSARVDAPSPYATKTFPTVVITEGATTNVDALTASVLTFNPTAVRDTLPVGGSRTKTFTMTNTTPDTVRFRITDDNALARMNRRIIDQSLPSVKRSMEQQRSATVGKGQRDPTPGQPASPNGRGGPDAFGYSWIDSDEPGGPVFNWFDISTIGTQITTLTSGTLDDGYLTLPIPFSFPLYGTTYSTMNIGTNGFANFGTGSSSLSNGAIPSTAVPNNALYAFWDDLDFRTSGKLLYYNDVANSRFVVQYDKAPRFGSTATDTLSFQMILKPNGEILYQFLRVVGSVLNSGTIGVENATGTVALQVVNNATYVHNNLAIRVFLPDAPWISENPTVGAIPPLGNQIVQCTFDATGLTAGTTYNANLSVDATHPDVSSPFVVPASLRVNVADSALLVLNKTSITFPGTVIGNTRRDTINARNAGALTLNVSSITTTNSRYTLSASSAVIAPGANTDIIVTYTPIVPAGTDTGRVIFLSNSQGTPRKDVTLTGTAIGAPIFSTVVDSLTKVVAARGLDSTQFFVRNTGTLVGNYAARAVMYPRTAAGDKPGEPIIIPMNVSVNRTPPVVNSNAAERSPFTSLTPFPVGQSPNALWDLQFNYDANAVTGAAGNAAAVFINNEFWTSRWATNILHRWTVGGTLIEQFTITGVTGVRGLATDGTFLYASTNTAAIYKINPVTKTLVSTITCAGAVTTRVIAYDPVRDGFWVSNFADALSCVNRSGAVIATISNTLIAKYGGAYDNYTPGGPYLWVFDQTATAGGPPQNVWQFNLNTLTSTGVSFDVLTRVTGGGATPIAGGLYIATGIVPGKVTIGGLLQGIPDRLFGLELANAGPGPSGPWLSIAPTAGTIAIGDSTQFTAKFDARDASIFTNPGSYFGRIEINATNSALADTLKIPVRMTVTPISGPALLATPDSVGYGNLAIGATDSSKSFLVKNFGNATLNVTNIVSNNTAFTPSRTSFSLVPNDTARVRVRFTAPTPAGVRNGTFTLSSNDPLSPAIVKVRGASVGAARIVVVPDTFYFSRAAGLDTTRTTFRVRNPGTDTLRYRIDEGSSAANDGAITRSTTQQTSYIVRKGEEDPTPRGNDSPDGRGGPDAFGYTWIDSDEPGGPAFAWTEISTIGTEVTGFTPNPDDGVATVTLPWAFPFYGASQTSLNIVTNGFLNFGTTSTAFTNGAIPSTAAPNNALYPFWDDFDFTTSGKVYTYNDVAGGRFIIQYHNAPRYGTTALDTLTFQVILKPSGEIRYQFLRVVGTVLNSGTIGVENATGVIALQVVNNTTYIHNNLAILITNDLVPWASTDRVSGTIAPADSQTVELRIHPANLAGGTYNGRMLVTGNAPDTGRVKIRLDITGGAPITVTVPNGGESWTIGSTQQIVWTRDPAQVDTVKIELSRAGSGGPWEVLTAGVPARPNTWIHPKGLLRPIEGSYFVSDAGTFNWTVTGPASTNCYVRVSKKSNATLFDISNAAFSIAAASTGDTSWVIQPSGFPTTTFYSAKAISNTVAWVAGTGGVVLRTTNGGTNWTSVGGGAIGTADIYTLEALDANTAFVSTSPGATFIYKTTNGGALWTQVYTLAATGAFIDGIIMTSATTGYAVGDPVPNPNGIWTCLRTTDGGATWARMATEPAQVGAEAGWNNSFQILGTTMWFGTNASKVYRSTDFGVTWTSAATPAVNGYGIAFNNATQGVLVSATGVTNRSTDGGTSWTAGGAAGTGQGSGASGVSGAEFWATVGTNVYYTTNGGTSWSAAAKNGYTGAAALWALDMVSPTAGSTYGWAGGATGTIVRYRRFATDVANGATEIPTVYALDQNFPNPFNPSTTIKFALPEQSIVSLKIYNLLGQEIATLGEGDMPAAFHTVVWSGRNRAGSQVATGMYFCRFEATGVSGTKFNSLKKLILLK